MALDMSKCERVWRDSSKLNLNYNPAVKKNDTGCGVEYALADVHESTAVIEYMMHPQLITLIPFQVQHRFKFEGNALFLQAFIHIYQYLCIHAARCSAIRASRCRCS